MSDISRNHASFRIGADIMTNPAGALPNARLLTERLGIEPSDVHDAGERRSAKAAPYKHGQWSLRSPLAEELELEVHVRWLLDRLLPVRDRVVEILKSDARLRADFYCGLWLEDENEGLTITPRTLADMSSLEADLGLDIYWEGVYQTESEM